MSNEVRGYSYAVGFTAPQLLIQITPLYWGLAVSWSKTSVATQIGCLSAKLEWAGYVFEGFAGWFDQRWQTYKSGRVWPK